MHGSPHPLDAKPSFSGTPQCWEQRYASGGNSGRGSYGQLAAFKADFLNDFVEREHVKSSSSLAAVTGISSH